MLWQAFGRWGAIAVAEEASVTPPEMIEHGAYNANSASASISCALPTNRQVGDICLINVGLIQGNPPFTQTDADTPAGWDRIGERLHSTAIGIRTIIFGRRLDGSEGASVNFTIVNPDAVSQVKATIFRGCAASGAYYEGVVGSNDSVSTVTCAQVTTTGAGRHIVDFVTAHDNMTMTATVRTLRYTESTLVGSDGCMSLASDDAGSAGVQPAGGGTLSGPYWSSVSFALLPV